MLLSIFLHQKTLSIDFIRAVVWHISMWFAWVRSFGRFSSAPPEKSFKRRRKISLNPKIDVKRGRKWETERVSLNLKIFCAKNIPEVYEQFGSGEWDVLGNKNEKSLNNSFGFCCGTFFWFCKREMVFRAIAIAPTNKCVAVGHSVSKINDARSKSEARCKK